MRKKKHHSASLARSYSNKIKCEGEIRETGCEPPISVTHRHLDYSDNHHEGAADDHSIGTIDGLK